MDFEKFREEVATHPGPGSSLREGLPFRSLPAVLGRVGLINDGGTKPLRRCYCHVVALVLGLILVKTHRTVHRRVSLLGDKK